MKPLVLFSSLAVLCAGGLMALSYKGLQDDPSALTSLSSGSQTVNIKPAEAVSNPPAAQQSAETETPPAAKAEEAAKTEEAPKAEEKVAAVEPKQTETAPSAEPAPEVKPVEETAKPDEETTKPEAAEAEPEGASFDIVRVEEDGSAVLAGRAEPGAKVRLLINQKVAGETQANDRGEWVVIPAEAMPAGAHQMQIETENAAGEVKLAEQSVALTVPDQPGTQPLIVLSETAKPSKVLQKPETAEVKQDEVKQDEVKQDEVKQADAGQVAEDSAASDQQPAAESKTAALQPSATATAPAVTSTGRALNVDVVDYNEAGMTTFSGRSTPNSTVRVYVDDVYTGAAVAGSDGTWSFTADSEIAAGPHRLRTDQIAQDGSVSERIELPFFRESPERIASLQAQRQTTTEQQQSQSAAEPAAAEPETKQEEAVEPSSDAETAKPETETSSTETATTTTPETKPADSVTATAETESVDKPEVAEAQPTSEIKGDAETTKPDPETASAEPQPTQQVAVADTAAEPVKPETTSEAAVPETSVEPAKPEISQQETAAVEPDTESAKPADLVPGTEDDEPAQETVTPAPDTSSTQTAAVTTESGQGETTPPATGKVVIQPGNNLWQISRVIYGKGRQYTVIYNANKDQIRDPDRIYPGQIFETPGSNAPESIDPSCRRPLAECE